jgi:hypothetical protein
MNGLGSATVDKTFRRIEAGFHANDGGRGARHMQNSDGSVT